MPIPRSDMDSRRLIPSPELRTSYRSGSNQQITVAGYGFKARAVQRPAGVRNGVPKQTLNETARAVERCAQGRGWD